MDWIRALKNATGPRRYVIGATVSVVVALFDQFKTFLAGWGMTELVGMPSWAAGTMVALGLVIYWLLQRLVKLERQIGGARVTLAKLRTRGVELRNQAQYGFLKDDELKEWERDTIAWNAAVISAIKQFSEADAEWFSILDVVPPPRIEMGVFHDDAEQKLFAFHDFRLRRLGQMIEETAPPLSASHHA